MKGFNLNLNHSLGTIKFTVDNGKAPLTSSFSTQPYDLCDGRWHSIQSKQFTLTPLIYDSDSDSDSPRLFSKLILSLSFSFGLLVSKMKNVVTLAVDESFGSPGIGQAGQDATDTDHPLYWGGHPNPDGKPGLETMEQFVGCMKNLQILGRHNLKYNHEAVQGTVGIHTCQTD